MPRRTSDTHRKVPGSTASRRAFDPDDFWRDHPHLIRAIRGPHERDVSSLPFRRPIAVDELEELLDRSEHGEPDEAVLDLRSEALPVRAWSASEGKADPQPEEGPESRSAPVLDLTGRLPQRTPTPAEERPRIPVVKSQPRPDTTRSEWLDDVVERSLPLVEDSGRSESEASEAEALRFARRIRRARKRTVGTPLGEWDPPAG